MRLFSVLWGSGSVCLGAIQIVRNLDKEWTDVDIDIDERVYRYEFRIFDFFAPVGLRVEVLIMDFR